MEINNNYQLKTIRIIQDPDTSKVTKVAIAILAICLLPLTLIAEGAIYLANRESKNSPTEILEKEPIVITNPADLIEQLHPNEQKERAPAFSWKTALKVSGAAIAVALLGYGAYTLWPASVEPLGSYTAEAASTVCTAELPTFNPLSPKIPEYLIKHGVTTLSSPDALKMCPTTPPKGYGYETFV